MELDDLVLFVVDFLTDFAVSVVAVHSHVRLQLKL